MSYKSPMVALPLKSDLALKVEVCLEGSTWQHSSKNVENSVSGQ